MRVQLFLPQCSGKELKVRIARCVLFVTFLLCNMFSGYSQGVQLTGKVTDAQGSTLAGVSVSEKGTTNATFTNDNGEFTISVSSGSAVLVFTSVGFTTSEVAVNNQSSLTVVLTESTDQLEEVVVTALGIERKAKSLTYSTQTVKGEDLTRVKDANPMNNLIGRVSGLQINRSSSGIGGSVNITLRGLKSNRNNQPLYVVDGLPITNTGGSGSEGPFGGGTDRGDILSTLNPEDIASINVLKGASASALYGSVGQNGAIMITTKKGAAGSTRIDFSSNATFDQAFYIPKMQYRYAQSPSTNGDAEESWGVKGDFEDHTKDFYQTGHTLINSIAASGGNDKVQNYFSYSNTTNKGVLPTNKFNQHTISFRTSSKLLKDRLTVDANIMYANQDVKNRPSSGLYFSPIAGLYMFPRGLDFDEFKNGYEYLSPSRNLMLQNWFNINAEKELTGTHHSQNPFWVLNNIPTFQTRHNVISAVNLRFAVNDWLNLSARGTLNRQWNKFERNVYAGTQGVLSGQTSANIPEDNGRYQRDESGSITKYGDLLLTGNKDLSEDFQLNFTAGTSITDETSSGWSLDARKLRVVNGFHMGNIFREDPINALNENFGRRQIQSLFASTNLGYKGYLFLDLTARNDWSSTLANTSSLKSGYFYYSAGITTVLSDYLKMPEWNNYSKVRLTFAQVGNDVAQYTTMIPQATYNSGLITPNNSGVFQDAELKPEISKSWEAGYEGRFINNRLNVDIAVYKTNTINQYFSFSGPLGLLNTTLYLNAGNVQNKGIEIAVNYDVIRGNRFSWNTGINYTANRNKIIELHPNLGERYGIGNFNVLRVGGTFGDIWARTFMRDDKGMLMVGANGRPMAGPDGYLGSTIPKAIVGWTNTLTVGKVDVSLTIDGRFGGKVISVTQGYLNSFGYSEESAAARDRGYVSINAVDADGNAVTQADPKEWYQGIGNRDGIIEGQLYSATNIRLREFSLSYRIPVASSIFKNANVSLVGRNLFFLKNDAPYDPELNTSTGVTGQGFDSFGLPTTRSIGLNLKLGF